jgi:hypothetical protein
VNIFVLDLDPKLCAQYHCDSHVVKMPIELAQLLSTCYRQHKTNLTKREREDLYRPGWQHHPCAVWLREARENYEWTYELYLELLNEFSHRFKSTHGAIRPAYCLRSPPPALVSKGSMTPFALAMPHKYKQADAVEAYRTYYREGKLHLTQRYKGRTPPAWLSNN